LKFLLYVENYYYLWTIVKWNEKVKQEGKGKKDRKRKSMCETEKKETHVSINYNL